MTTRRTAGPVDGAKSPAATLTTLDAQAVTIADGVWARRQAVNHDAALPHGFRMLEVVAIDEYRAEVGQDQRVVRREDERAPKARFRAVAVVSVMLADPAVDPNGGVGIGEAADVIAAQRARFRVLALSAEQMREVAERLPMARMRCKRGAIRRDRALKLPPTLQGESEIIEQARVPRRRSQRAFVRCNRFVESVLLAVQVAEVEGRVGMVRVALQRAPERRFGRDDVAAAQDAAEQGPGRRVRVVQRQRFAAAALGERRLAPFPCGACGTQQSR